MASRITLQNAQLVGRQSSVHSIALVCTEDSQARVQPENAMSTMAAVCEIVMDVS